MLDFRESVNAVSNKFARGVYGFFIDTEFGVIGVEEVTEDFDPMSPVEVRTWANAPATTFCIRNRHITADFWVGIAHTDRKFPAHAHIVEGIVSVMFMYILGVVPDEDIVDAAISIYLTEVENKSTSYNLIKDEFMKMNVELLPRSYGSVNMIVDKLLHTRIDASWQVIKESRGLMRHPHFTKYSLKFHEYPYYMELFALILFTVRRHPELKILDRPGWMMQRYLE